MIAVVDYRKGNLKSVERGIAGVGGDVRVTDDARIVARADAVVLPGVGAFADAAAAMRDLGLADAVCDRIFAGTPFLGICLGLQLMFDEGEEDDPSSEDVERHRGLGILPGTVARMPRTDAQGTSYKIPHVGWNTVDPPASDGSELCDQQNPQDGGFASPLLAGVPAGEYFYFTHSFAAPAGSYTLATTTHSVTFPSIVQYGEAAFGVQFHPEKSSDAGMRVLRNFVDIAKEAR